MSLINNSARATQHRDNCDMQVRKTKNKNINKATFETASALQEWLITKIGKKGAPKGASIFLCYDNKNLGRFLKLLVAREFKKNANGAEFGKIICRNDIVKYDLDNPAKYNLNCFAIIDQLEAFTKANTDNEVFHITNEILKDRQNIIFEKITDETKKRFDITIDDAADYAKVILDIIEETPNTENPSLVDAQRKRVKYSDPVAGFAARKKEHENWFRRNFDGRYPKSGTVEAYCIRDFIDEEYGDLIEKKTLTRKLLREFDNDAFKSLTSYIQRIRIGNITGKKPEEANTKTILSDTTPSIRATRENILGREKAA